MTDSAPALRRMLNEARERIRELEAREIEVREIERVVYVDKPRDVLQSVYVDRVVEVPGPERVVYKDVIEEVPGPERVVEKNVPIYVDRIEYRDVIKEVEVPVEVLVDNPVIVEVPIPQYPPSVERVEILREVYVDNPSHIETIRALQEKLCQFTSQSDSSQNPDQSDLSSESADSSTEAAE